MPYFARELGRRRETRGSRRAARGRRHDRARASRSARPVTSRGRSERAEPRRGTGPDSAFAGVHRSRRRRRARCATRAASHRRAARSATASSTGLHVGRRARDHAQDLADRRLLVERLLRLVEQAHVVDRDRRLPRERLHQRDLVGANRPGLARGRGRCRRRHRLRASAAPRAPRASRTRACCRARPGTRCRARHACRRRGSSVRSITARPVIDVALERHGRGHRAGPAGSSRRSRRRERSSSPSTSMTRANGASHRCAARSATASSTGCTSVGELEITRRISLIAVCCSSEFVSSLRALVDLALEAGVRLAQLRRHPVELVGERLQLVAGAHVDRWSRSPSPIRCAPSSSVRIGRTMPRASASAPSAEITRPASSRSAGAHDRRVELRVHLGHRLLDEHLPAERRSAPRQTSTGVPAKVGHDRGLAGAGAVERGLHVRELREIRLAQHEADVGIGDEEPLRSTT